MCCCVMTIEDSLAGKPMATPVYLCDNNIGLVLVCLPHGSTNASVSPIASEYMTQPSWIPILFPVLFMQVGDPFLNYEEFFIYLSRLLF